MSWLALLGLCGAAAVAARLALRRDRQAFVLVPLCALGFLAWPGGLDPHESPITFVMLLAPLLAAAALLLVWLKRPALGAAGAVLALLCVYALRLWLSARPGIGGTDFFAYVCFSRDSLDGVDLPQRFVYFPGVYLFWKAALLAGHRSLGTLQWWSAAVLLLGAVLAGAIAGRASRSIFLGLGVAGLQLALSLDLEGSRGMTEPLAVVPALVGLALWAGAPLTPLNAAALGAGFGAAIYCKQQAALLAPGWLALVLLRLRTRDDSWRELLLVPAASALTLAALFALSGGVDAFTAGLGLVRAYQPAGFPFLVNIDEARHRMTPLFGCFLLALLGFLVLALRGDSSAQLRAAGVLLLGGASGLLQFRTRFYPHYALLPLPLMLCGVALIGHLLWLRLKAALPGALSEGALPLIFALALLGRAAARAELPVLSLQQKPETLEDWPYPLGAAAERLQELHLPPGEGAYVMPPVHDGAHFLLGTRAVGAREAYFWGSAHAGDALAAVSDARTRVVIVRPELPIDLERQVCDDAGCREAFQRLPSLGYREALRTRDVLVFRR